MDFMGQAGLTGCGDSSR